MFLPEGLVEVGEGVERLAEHRVELGRLVGVERALVDAPAVDEDGEAAGASRGSVVGLETHSDRRPAAGADLELSRWLSLVVVELGVDAEAPLEAERQAVVDRHLRKRVDLFADLAFAFVGAVSVVMFHDF